MPSRHAGPVDGFWQVWAYHHISPKVPEFLEQLRVGALSDWTPADDCLDDGGYYANEPRHRRGAGQRVLALQPWDSETEPAVLAASYLTPLDDFFVRNHAPVPTVSEKDAREWDVSFYRSENGASTKKLEAESSVEIAQLPLPILCALFPSATVTSVLQCAGNRAADNIAANPGAPNGFVGTPYEVIGVGMVGNAQWRGPRLCDVLPALFPEIREIMASGLSLDGFFVEFEGADG